MFAIQSCSPDDGKYENLTTQVSNKYAGDVIHIDVKDVPALKQFFTSNKLGLFTNGGMKSASQTYVQTPAGNIPLADVMQVIDTTGAINYSFYVEPLTNNHASFDNFVIHQEDSNAALESYFLRYEPTLTPVGNSLLDLANQELKVRRIEVNEFINRNPLPPCPGMTLSGNNDPDGSSGSGFTNTGNGSNTGGSTGGGTGGNTDNGPCFTIIEIPCGNTGAAGPQSFENCQAVSWGSTPGAHDPPEYVMIEVPCVDTATNNNKSFIRNAIDPCPVPTGDVGIVHNFSDRTKINCDSLKDLDGNTTIALGRSTLLNLVNSNLPETNREYGYHSSVNLVLSNLIEGKPNKRELDLLLNTNTRISVFMHSHSTAQDSKAVTIPSIEDLFQMNTLLQQFHDDGTPFVYYVVTHNRTYALMLNDKSKFNSLIQSYMANNGLSKKFAMKSMARKLISHGYRDNATHGNNEKAFMSLINQFGDVGIEVFEQEHLNNNNISSSWSRLYSAGPTSVVKIECN